MIDCGRAVEGSLYIRCTSVSLVRFQSRPGRLDDYDASELICADIVVVYEILQSPTKLLRAGVDLVLAEDDDGDDLVSPHTLLDAALSSVSRALDENTMRAN